MLKIFFYFYLNFERLHSTVRRKNSTLFYVFEKTLKLSMKFECKHSA